MREERTITKHTNTWQIGKVTITRIVEFEVSGQPPSLILANVEPEHVKRFNWLRPHYADDDGQLDFSVHAYVIESEGRRIIVDTCVGNDKQRNLPHFDQLEGPFLDQLAAAGYPAESVDMVLCTHLHADHVGWNTRLVDGRWVPTFPNARYLFGRVEWEHWNDENRSSSDVLAHHHDMILSVDNVMADSIRPIVDAGLHMLVETDHRLTTDVCLIPTPGHTPGHVSVRIRSDGEEAIIMGDMIHHPIQIADASIGSLTDVDLAMARTTRQGFLLAHCDQDVLVLGTHFPTPAAGRIVRDEHGWRLDTSTQLLSTAKEMT